MTHPSGAGYKHEPKFIERMKHAEGGPATTPWPGGSGQQSESPGGVLGNLKENESFAKQDLDNEMYDKSSFRKDQFFDSGTNVPGRQAGRNEDWERSHGIRRADGGSTAIPPKYRRRLTPRRSGGKACG